MRVPDLSFNSIHIIESLPSVDLHTGQRLYHDLSPLGDASTPPVTVCFHPVQSCAAFLDVLRAIAEDARVYARWSILHIEAHGDFRGINVASGEYLPWREFEDALIAINQHSRLNLLVVIASCQGAHLVKVITSQLGELGRAPMRCLIGPVRVVTTREIELACSAFYRALFDTVDGRMACRAMNDAVAPGRRTFRLFTAESLFYRVMRDYLATRCSEDALASRENKLAAELVEMGMSGEDLERGRQALRRCLRDQRPYFEQWKECFFFCDLYPENAARFDVTFEECQNASHEI